MEGRKTGWRAEVMRAIERRQEEEEKVSTDVFRLPSSQFYGLKLLHSEERIYISTFLFTNVISSVHRCRWS